MLRLVKANARAATVLLNEFNACLYQRLLDGCERGRITSVSTNFNVCNRVSM
jgi:hypothetical protein